MLSDLANAILMLDESDIVLLFKKSLEHAGFTNVFSFTDPLLALEHFKVNSDKYALIITDMRMPKMNGIEFVQKVRSINQTVKVILLSGFDLKELQIIIPADLQIAECLEKPIKLSLLNKIVAKYITIE